jgi:hypothetical protein
MNGVSESRLPNLEQANLGGRKAGQGRAGLPRRNRKDEEYSAIGDAGMEVARTTTRGMGSTAV